MRAKRILMAAMAALAMAACGSESTGPDENTDGLGPNVTIPRDPPDGFTGTGSGDASGTGGAGPASGVSPTCESSNLMSIIKEGPNACNRR